jgi:L-malate glycosyltransferase
MKKIIVICPFPENEVPGQRLKYEQYFDSWRANGFDVTVKPFVSDKFMKIIYQPGYYHLKAIYTIIAYFKRFVLLFSLRKYDIVYTFLWVTPFGPPIFEKIYAILAKNLIYDIDDLVFLKHQSKANQLIGFLKGRSKSIYLMKKAKHVITCTPYLDNFVRQYNPNTTDISSTVDTQKRYVPVNNYQNDHQIIIGWSGSHSTSKYLYLLKDVLKELAQQCNFKLLVMGDASFSIKGLDIEVLEWKEESEIATLQRFDIGLYPLPDEQWVYGKSGLKAIQYMALGIPTVASNIGTIDRIIDHNENGFLINDNNHHEWLNYLKILINDAELRGKLGSKARSKIDKEFSIHQNEQKYLNILNFF